MKQGAKGRAAVKQRIAMPALEDLRRVCLRRLCIYAMRPPASEHPLPLYNGTDQE